MRAGTARSSMPVELRLQVSQPVQQRAKGQDPAVVVHLERADAGGQLQHAGDGALLQPQHQGMDPEAQVDVQDLGAVLDQQVLVAAGAIDHADRVALESDPADRRVGERSRPASASGLA